ncbi:hypothetical protein VKT23_010674 [Stygiomarasmius scandens]|uniref:F-box domain-containing protein n=1 Tax=Marasmiellus scandens TaxID=2682957 RepID=A0ABR1JED2_9AGAR
MPSECPFSQELIDCIIDELQNSVQDLKSCSLVCYRWLPRTRKHLFSSLSLPCNQIKPGRQHKGEELTVAEIEERIRSLGQILVPTKCSSLPNIASFVNKLVLSADSSWGLTNRVHSFCLNSFADLREISIINFSFDVIPPESLNILPNLLRVHHNTLHTLTLKHLSFDKPSDLIDLLSECNFPSLRRFCFVDVNFHPLEDWRVDSSLTNDAQVASRRPVRPKLESLELSCIPELIGPLFLDPYPFFDLSELRHLKTTNNTYRFRRIFSEYGKSIRDIEMDFPPHALALTSLQPLTNLVNITFHSCIYTNQFHSLPSFISFLPSHKHLAVRGKFPYEAPMENILTSCVDSELERVFIQNRDRDRGDAQTELGLSDGGSSGVDTDGDGEAQKMLPESLLFVFEFPMKYGCGAAEKEERNEAWLRKTRKVLDVDVVCKKYYKHPLVFWNA